MICDVLGLWVLGACLLGALLVVMDKAAARREGWRIPEASLLVVALVGGWPGMWIAMRIARHKVRKREFLVRFGVVAIVSLGVLAYLYIDCAGA